MITKLAKSYKEYADHLPYIDDEQTRFKLLQGAAEQRLNEPPLSKTKALLVGGGLGTLLGGAVGGRAALASSSKPLATQLGIAGGLTAAGGLAGGLVGLRSHFGDDDERRDATTAKNKAKVGDKVYLGRVLKDLRDADIAKREAREADQRQLEMALGKYYNTK